MSNYHRITWIDLQIRHKQYPNCRKIAAQFEISGRQAARDIEYLRDTMGAPIAYCAKNNGYYYSEPAYILPAQWVTATEKQTLSYLAYQYQSNGSAWSNQLAALFERLAGTEHAGEYSGPAVPVYQVKPREAMFFDVLRSGIENLTKVELAYCDIKGVLSHRVVCPYKLFARSGVNYLAAFCELRSEIRVFRLNRIRECRPTGETFTVSPVFKPEMYSCEEPLLLQEPYQAVIRLERVPELEAFKRPPQLVADHTYRIDFYDSGEFLRELLVLSAGFTIMAPNWLRDRLRRKLDAIYEANFGNEEK